MSGGTPDDETQTGGERLPAFRRLLASLRARLLGLRPPSPDPSITRSESVKDPSRRALLGGWLEPLADREKMGELGRQAGRAVREFKEAERGLQQLGEEVEESLVQVAQEVQDAVDPPAIPRAQYEAAEARVAALEEQVAALAAAQSPADDPAQLQALMQEIAGRLEQLDTAVDILAGSASARDRAESDRWAKLRERLWALLAGAGGTLAVKTAEALYEGWVQENLWPLLPEWVRRPWETAVHAQGAQPPSPLPQPESPVPVPAELRQPEESPLPEPEPPPEEAGPGSARLPETVYVRAGWFRMGSDKRRDTRADDDETRQHWVWLGGYRIGKYPVTNAQYASFVRATNHRAPYHWTDGRIPEGKANHPVVNVSWRDAGAYCEWLAHASGRRCRLPTEAEWEKAARGADGRIWPWGDTPPTDRHCNFNRNNGDTTAVGSYPLGASPYGALDMAGNVWEWTGSLYKPYPYDAAGGREDPAAEGTRTLRGGAYYSDIARIRSAARYRGNLDFRLDDSGFRLVVVPGLS